MQDISLAICWLHGPLTIEDSYLDDCVDGTLRLFDSEYSDPVNIGSDEQVSINQMIDLIEDIAGHKVKRNYLLDKPLGVRGRSSDNSLIREKISWDTEITLKKGLEKTYKWIFDEISSGKNNNKVMI